MTYIPFTLSKKAPSTIDTSSTTNVLHILHRLVACSDS